MSTDFSVITENFIPRMNWVAQTPNLDGSYWAEEQKGPSREAQYKELGYEPAPSLKTFFHDAILTPQLLAKFAEWFDTNIRAINSGDSKSFQNSPNAHALVNFLVSIPHHLAAKVEAKAEATIKALAEGHKKIFLGFLDRSQELTKALASEGSMAAILTKLITAAMRVVSGREMNPPSDSKEEREINPTFKPAGASTEISAQEAVERLVRLYGDE